MECYECKGTGEVPSEEFKKRLERATPPWRGATGDDRMYSWFEEFGSVNVEPDMVTCPACHGSGEIVTSR